MASIKRSIAIQSSPERIRRDARDLEIALTNVKEALEV